MKNLTKIIKEEVEKLLSERTSGGNKSEEALASYPDEEEEIPPIGRSFQPIDTDDPLNSYRDSKAHLKSLKKSNRFDVGALASPKIHKKVKDTEDTLARSTEKAKLALPGDRKASPAQVVSDPNNPNTNIASFPAEDPDGEAPRPDMQSDPLMPYYDEMTPEEEKQLKRELDNALADALIQSFKNPIEQSKILNKYVADIGKNLGAMYKDGKQFVRTKRAAQTRNNKKTGFSMKDVQRMLIRQRLLPTSGYDGKYGINTMTAIMNFQRKNKLKPDGIVGPSTGARLEALSLSPEEKAAKLKAAMRADDVNKRAGQSMAAVDTFMDKNKGVRTAATNPQVKTKRDTRKLARKRPPLKEENSKVYNYLEKLINQEIDKILG